MVDITTGPLTKRAYELCLQADRLPYAGLELTALNTALSEFMVMCETHERGAAGAIRRWREYEDRAAEMANALYNAFVGYESDGVVSSKMADLIGFLECSEQAKGDSDERI